MAGHTLVSFLPSAQLNNTEKGGVGLLELAIRDDLGFLMEDHQWGK